MQCQKITFLNINEPEFHKHRLLLCFNKSNNNHNTNAANLLLCSNISNNNHNTNTANLT